MVWPSQSRQAITQEIRALKIRLRRPRRNSNCDNLSRCRAARHSGWRRPPKPQAPPLAPLCRRERAQLSARPEGDRPPDRLRHDATRAHRALFAFCNAPMVTGFHSCWSSPARARWALNPSRGVLLRQSRMA